MLKDDPRFFAPSATRPASEVIAALGAFLRRVFASPVSVQGVRAGHLQAGGPEAARKPGGCAAMRLPGRSLHPFAPFLLVMGGLAAGSVSANDRYRFNAVDYPSLGAAESAMRSAAGPLGPSLSRCGEGSTSATSSTITYCAPTRTPIAWFDHHAIPAISDQCPVTDPNLGPRCRDEGTAVSLMLQHFQQTSGTNCFVSSTVAGGYATQPDSWSKQSYFASGVFEFAYLAYSLGQGPTPRQLLIQYRRCSNPDAPVYTAAYPIGLGRFFKCPVGWNPVPGMPPSRFDDACVAPTFTITKSSAQNVTTCPRTGHPCSPFTGEKLFTEVDFELPGLALVRHYASGRDTPARAGLGDAWTFLGSERLALPRVHLNANATPQYRDASNNLETFVRLNATHDTYTSELQRGRVLHPSGSGTWTLHDPSGTVRVFDALGRLIRRIDRDQPAAATLFSYANDRLDRITVSNGRTYTLLWAQDRLSAIKAPDGSDLLLYGYDTAGRLSSVTHADGRQRIYHYGEAANLCIGAASSCQASFFPNHLTGVTDERGIRRLDALYDGSGRVVASDEPGTASKTDVVYPNATTTEVVESGQGRVVWTFTPDLARRPLTRTTFIGSTQVSSESWAYLTDTSVRHTDARGVTSRRYHNGAGLPTQVIEGESIAGSTSSPLKRTTINTWSTDPVPRLSSTELRNATGTPIHRTEYLYTDAGQLRLVRQTDPVRGVSRADESTFCTEAHASDPSEACPIVGLLRTTIAPGGALTRYRYHTADAPSCTPTSCDYRRGDLASITNAAGHVVSFPGYDPFGRPTRMVSPNGLQTTLRYASNGKPDLIVSGGLATTIAYTATGKIRSITLPSGQSAVYGYDGNDRLTTVTDAAGNQVVLTLDDAGLPTTEERLTAGGALHYRLTRGIDALGRLRSMQEGSRNPSQQTYSAFDDPDRATDPLGRVTDSDSDPFGRVSRITQDLGGIGSLQSFTYTPLDQLETVTDPKALVTRYTRNALGDLLQLESPDTGTTTFTYDAAGRLETQTDARGVTVTFGHDALRRPTSVSYPTPSLNVTYGYDSADGCPTGENFALGQLTSMTDSSGSTRWCYDQLGRLTRKVQITGSRTFTTAYGYDAQGRLATQTLPSGAVVTFGYAAGEVATVSVRLPGSTIDLPLMSSIERLPFGPVSKLTYGNGRTQTRVYDQGYAIDAITSSEASGWTQDYVLNDALEVTAILGTGADNRYQYDGLGRLRAINDPQSVPKGTFGYDATGNRTAATWLGTSSTLTYPSTSHRLSAVAGEARTYDAMGNPLTIGTRQLRYDDRAKLDQVTLPSGEVWQYGYTAQGLRVTKRNPNDASSLRHFVYDESAQLLGEYDQHGTPLREVIWLGNLPIGVIDGSAATPVLHYIESDHLGTPRVVVDATRNVGIWRWNQTDDPFGRSLPNSNPDGDATSFAFNLRFAGQYHDAETGWNYNVHRYYDPTIGRYLESDPIGLGGGINTYGYVGGNPLRFNDPLGLVYGDGVIQFEDVLFGPTLWMQKKLGMGEGIPQGLVDGAAGFGDGLTGGVTGWVRNGLGVDSSVNRCSSMYQGAEWAGIGAGLAVPIGRIGYVAKVGALPRSGMTVEAIVAQRNALKAYFRGRPLDQIMPAIHPRFGYPTIQELRLVKTDAAIIAASGRTDAFWTGFLAYGGSSKSGLSAGNAAFDDCGCAE